MLTPIAAKTIQKLSSPGSSCQRNRKHIFKIKVIQITRKGGNGVNVIHVIIS
jgi:hypothetical protein